MSWLSVCGPCLPIWRTKRPSGVNFRIWPSVSPLPASQTKPLWSIVDAVLVLRPLIALPGPAPGLRISVPAWSNSRTGRRRLAAAGARRIEARRLLVVGERARALDHPDIVLRVDRDARGLTHDPVVRQALRPGRVDLEAERLLCGRADGEPEQGSDDQPAQHASLPDDSVFSSCAGIRRRGAPPVHRVDGSGRSFALRFRQIVRRPWSTTCRRQNARTLTPPRIDPSRPAAAHGDARATRDQRTPATPAPSRSCAPPKTGAEPSRNAGSKACSAFIAGDAPCVAVIRPARRASRAGAVLAGVAGVAEGADPIRAGRGALAARAALRTARAARVPVARGRDQGRAAGIVASTARTAPSGPVGTLILIGRIRASATEAA